MLPRLSVPYDECCLAFWNFPFSVLQFNPQCGQEFVFLHSPSEKFRDIFTLLRNVADQHVFTDEKQSSLLISIPSVMT